LIGTMSGITWFITQQARYQHFANVSPAAIAMIGSSASAPTCAGADRAAAIPVDRSL